MKKRRTSFLSLLLAVLLLSGCTGERAPTMQANGFKSSSGQSIASRGGLAMLPFDQMEYTRPDLEDLRQAVSAVESALEGGDSLRTVMRRLDDCYTWYFTFQTMHSLADIRSCQDVTDKFYAVEFAWCDESYSAVQQLMEELLYLCGGSELAQKLEEQYFWQGFAKEYADASNAALNDQVVSLMRRESALLAEYRSLAASPTLEVGDREVDYYSHVSELEGSEQLDAMDRYYEKYNEDYARIYIDMVKVRQELAATLGFDSYEQMQYAYFFERDYSPDDAAAYIRDIKTYMIPFYKEVMARNPYDRIAYPYLSESRLHEVVGAAASRIGGDVKKAFEFMTAYDLYDIRLSEKKAPMSYQTYLSDYEAPFVCLSPYGDAEDILSFSHEFGHYVDAFVNYDAYETIDVAECFSQGMEVLMLSYYSQGLSREEIDNLCRMKMLDSLETYIQQASFAEFETVVYSADPELLSADFLNDLSLRLAIDYGYYDGESETYYAMSWSDISHFFEQPFYVITYPVANDAAMQLYELERQEEGLGVKKYLQMRPRTHEGLIDTLTEAGLESPFAPGRIQQVVEDLRPRLLDQGVPTKKSK